MLIAGQPVAAILAQFQTAIHTVYMLPANHDPLNAASVYQSSTFCSQNDSKTQTFSAAIWANWERQPWSLFGLEALIALPEKHLREGRDSTRGQQGSA
jgi:hypothetical protein